MWVDLLLDPNMTLALDFKGQILKGPQLCIRSRIKKNCLATWEQQLPGWGRYRMLTQILYASATVQHSIDHWIVLNRSFICSLFHWWHCQECKMYGWKYGQIWSAISVKWAKLRSIDFTFQCYYIKVMAPHNQYLSIVGFSSVEHMKLLPIYMDDQVSIIYIAA